MSMKGLSFAAGGQRVLQLSQRLCQAMRHADSPLLQIPHFTTERAAAAAAASQARTMLAVIELPRHVPGCVVAAPHVRSESLQTPLDAVRSDAHFSLLQ